MAFPNWLSVKQNLQKLPSLESMLYSRIWTLETNAYSAPTFFSICTLVENSIRNNFSFVSGTNSAPINSEKSTTELNGHIAQNLEDFEFNSRFRNPTTLRVF
jgi:hypothetical protein